MAGLCCVCTECQCIFANYDDYYNFPLDRYTDKLVCSECEPKVKRKMRPNKLPKSYTFFCLSNNDEITLEQMEEEGSSSNARGYLFATFEELENQVIGKEVGTILSNILFLPKDLIHLIVKYYVVPYHWFGILQAKSTKDFTLGVETENLGAKLQYYKCVTFTDWKLFAKKVHHVDHMLIECKHDTTWRPRKKNLSKRVRDFQDQLLKLNSKRFELERQISAVTRRIEKGEESCDSDQEDYSSDPNDYKSNKRTRFA